MFLHILHRWNIVLISASQMIHLDSVNDTFRHQKQYVCEVFYIFHTVRFRQFHLNIQVTESELLSDFVGLWEMWERKHQLSLSIYLSSHLLWPCRFFVGDKNLVNNQSLHGRCRRHQMIVASYAAMPIGMAKWLGKIWIYKKCKPLGLRHGSSCPLHNSKELYVCLPTQPFRNT